MTQPTDESGAVGDANEFDIVDATAATEEDPWLAAEGEDENEDDAAPETDEAEQTEEEAKPEEPAIQPPNSLTAEEKEAFKALPREAQEFTARRIGDLEKGFQSKAIEASQVRQTVENEARQAIAQLSQQTAAELHQYAAQFTPQRPDPAMIQYDAQGFYAAQAQYEAALAQRTQAQQQAAHYEAQAKAQHDAIRQTEQQAEIATLREQFPEWLDPSEGPKRHQALTSIALDMGYSAEHVVNARAVDILAMRKVAEIAAERDSLKAQIETLNKAKMANVRAAKDLPRVTKAGAPQSVTSGNKAELKQLKEGMKRGNRGAADLAFERFV